MTQWLVVIVVGLLLIAGSTLIGPRLGVASPLLLVAIGVAASFLPTLSAVTIDPEWVLEGLLPPLLYSAAVSMPTMNFRREFGAIGGLSVILVVATSLALGLLFMVAIPDLGFAWGVALGAIVSPTDAVATSIVKKSSASKRVVAILDGESLLNDATALVLLRTAIVATAASFSFWGAVGSFAYSIVVATAVGGIVGAGNLALRKKVTDPTVNTAISFTIPFIASIPAELAGASGLVAAVVAGLVTGFRAPRKLSPASRLSDSQNWHTVELVLEGVVFLAMGLQIRSIVISVERDHAGVMVGIAIASCALLATIVIRALYVAPLLRSLSRRGKRIARLQPHMEGLQERINDPEWREQKSAAIQQRRRWHPARDFDRLATRITRGLADIDYFLRAPLGWRDGVTVVWAGMRGAVTVAAAQTLPADTPHRSLLVLVAFAVAVLSLALQGGTIGPLVRRIAPATDPAAAEAEIDAERIRLLTLIHESSASIVKEEPAEGATRREQFEAERRYRLAVLAAQRSALLDARDNGIFDADVLADTLLDLDAAQLAMQIRGGGSGNSRL